MKKAIILLAGYPATGKSYMCNLILKEYPKFVTVNQDELKEEKWDQFGFDNLEEKTNLEMLAWKEYYDTLEQKMGEDVGIVSDYPFSDKQKQTLADLVQKFNYSIITVRLVGDIDKLYERSRKRDLGPNRHLGHLVSRYHKGDVMKDRSQADCLVTYEIFRDRCLNKGYDKFELGYLIEIDATDVTKIDYPEIISKIKEFLNEEI